MENDGTLSSVTRRNNGVGKDFNVRKALLERPEWAGFLLCRL